MSDLIADLIAEIKFEAINSEIDRHLAGRIITALRAKSTVQTSASTDTGEAAMIGSNTTPGQWSYRPDQLDDWGIVRAGLFVICQARDPRYMDEEYLKQCREDRRDPWEANARLIAAAPETAAERDRLKEANTDLLAALKALLRFVEAHTETGEVIPPYTVEHVRARTAIAKAEGQQP